MMRKVIHSAFISFCFELLPALLHAQGEPGNWLMYFGQSRFSDKVSLHSEVQYRLHTIAPDNIEQLLLRTGLNYHFADNAFATAGYAYVTLYDFDGEYTSPDSREHRIWQQLITTQKLGRLKLEHRYRAEQRWVNGDYRNRLRYRLMAFLPLNNPVIEPGTFFIGVYDELFLNTERPFFDRNRLYAALGYQFSPAVALQGGFLRQDLAEVGKNYLQVAGFVNLDLRRD